MGAYLGNLYSALQTLTNAPVDFATSMVSFERVFEVLDLPLEIVEKPGAYTLKDINGVLEFDDVSFRYIINEQGLLKEVHRFGQMQDIQAVLSGDVTNKRPNGEEAEEVKAGAVNQTQTNVLEHISFRAEPSQLVALVGPVAPAKQP